ncbi:hypothetical protein LRAMOSA05180 [Lichtheimia ramosa]|uniref:DUF1772 domain-containing protein n=1 Tax=Lichtheimia ramosa TaxID=688394 RepID=A0A077WZK3_9FUNG|nr:hypothetical protein LRAMOSA05180 [Lichtheimia ramosa]
MSTVLSNLRPIAITANGIFAGLGLSITFATVPALRAAGYPPRAWQVVYRRGAAIAISSILISSAAHFTTYYLTHDKRSLWCGVISFFSAPWTMIFMKPTNDRLGQLADTNSKEDASQLIEKWNKLQYARTWAGCLAFVLAVF